MTKARFGREELCAQSCTNDATLLRVVVPAEAVVSTVRVVVLTEGLHLSIQL